MVNDKEQNNTHRIIRYDSMWNLEVIGRPNKVAYTDMETLSSSAMHCCEFEMLYQYSVEYTEEFKQFNKSVFVHKGLLHEKDCYFNHDKQLEMLQYYSDVLGLEADVDMMYQAFTKQQEQSGHGNGWVMEQVKETIDSLTYFDIGKNKYREQFKS